MEFNDLEDVFDAELINRLKRIGDGENLCYIVTFRDGTIKKFYKARDIVRFAKLLYDFWRNI